MQIKWVPVGLLIVQLNSNMSVTSERKAAQTILCNTAAIKS